MTKLMYPRLWIDIETTGLDPDVDKILEIAWGIQFDTNIEPQWKSEVVNYPKYHLNEVTLQMHTQNNLLSDCMRCCRSIDSIMAQVKSDIKTLFERDISQFQIAGASPNFDKSFLLNSKCVGAYFVGFFNNIFHHRIFDVSSLISLAQEKGYKYQTKQSSHRALDDIQESYRMYKELSRKLNI